MSGRRQSRTAEFFPHYANQSRVLTILKHKFGNDGYAFFFQLMEFIASTPEHAPDILEPLQREALFAHCGVGPELGGRILSTLATLGAIDAELLAEDIIWCPELVESLSALYSKRKGEMPKKPFPPRKCQFPEQESRDKGDFGDISAPEMQQRREEKRKEEQEPPQPPRGGEGESISAPEMLNPVEETPDMPKEGGGLPRIEPTTGSPQAGEPDLYAEAFEVFWRDIPAKNGKKLQKADTLEEFRKLKPRDIPLVLQAARNYAASERVQQGIGIRDPIRFFRRRGEKTPFWQEWIEPEQPKGGNNGTKGYDWRGNQPSISQEDIDSVNKRRERERAAIAAKAGANV